MPIDFTIPQPKNDASQSICLSGPPVAARSKNPMVSASPELHLRRSPAVLLPPLGWATTMSSSRRNRLDELRSL